jgi:hypothetical protein
MRLVPLSQQHLQQRGLGVLAAFLVSASSLTTQPLPAALAEPPPNAEELSRLTLGLSRVDYLLTNWDEITTECKGLSAGGDLEDAQVVRTQNQNKCYKTPLKVQRYVGASSTLDPLFKAEKLMIRAQPLVPAAKQEAYSDAVDAYITTQQMSSTMAYTSSWSGIENPNGSKEQIDENLLEAKNEVKKVRTALGDVVELLDLPRPPAFDPSAYAKK